MIQKFKNPGFIYAVLATFVAGGALAEKASLGAPQAGPDLGWRIKKDHWSETDERGYSKFVAAIGESGCKSIDQCMKSPANPFRGSDPATVRYFSDCADLPYFLRTYYAWKNGLPFSFVSDVESAPSHGGSRDIRYSPEGNRPARRTDITWSGRGSFPNGVQSITQVENATSSAMFRYHPKSNDSKLFTDFYPVKLSRDSIAPGTMIYDPNGHVAVVYKVMDDGRVLFMDAHPDNSLTHGTYGAKFERSRPGMGAGFKKWRPIRLVDSSVDAEGNQVGGRIVGSLNEEITDYSDEQFFGTQPDPSGSWKKGTFASQGQLVDYYDYVRRSLAVGDLKYHPVVELKNMLGALCQDLHDRADAVQQAITLGFDRKSHPSHLPDNIYGTEGDWEQYSSPSRDARLKTSFKEARDKTQEFIEKFKAHDPSIVYDAQSSAALAEAYDKLRGFAARFNSHDPLLLASAPDAIQDLRDAFNGIPELLAAASSDGNSAEKAEKNLAADLLAVYKSESLACQVTYTMSNGQQKTLTLADIQHRLYDLSFDPYDCVERRWGATDPAELAACREDAEKQRWYLHEQRLRNQLDRVYDIKMGFDLDQLKQQVPGSGVSNAPDVDIESYLASLGFMKATLGPGRNFRVSCG